MSVHRSNEQPCIFQVAHEPSVKKVYGCEEIAGSFPDYLRDESGMQAQDIQGIFFPRSPEEVAWVVAHAAEKGVRLTVSGGRTGICGGAVPQGGFLVSLERMTRVIRLEEGTAPAGSAASGADPAGLATPGADPAEWEITVESGLRLNDLAEMLRRKDTGTKEDPEAVKRFGKTRTPYVYPPDPTEATATVGGTIATNASGARTFYYGPTRDYVVGLEAVLPTGELLKVRRGQVFEKDGFFTIPREQGEPLRVPAPGYRMPETKHAAGFYSAPGMDLVDLFIGSEGILGIVVRATLRLVQAPDGIMGAVGFFASEEKAIGFVEQARAQQPRPLALEYFDRDSLNLLREAREKEGSASEIPAVPDADGAVYFEIAFSGPDSGSGLEGLVNAWYGLMGEAGASAWGALTRRDLDRLKSFRHALPESVNQIIARSKMSDERIHKVGTDMAVPDDKLREMLRFYRAELEPIGLEYLVFGHVGNSHLHVNMIPGNYGQLQQAKELYRRFAQKAVSLGGTVSAEHGIGRIKREYLSLLYGREELDQMRSIKQAFDPDGRLNPEVLL